MLEGTTSRVMAADKPYGELYDFYTPSYVSYASDYAYVTGNVSGQLLNFVVQELLWAGRRK
jgi:hypothetical protein